jgi:hypothetical protein
VNKIKPISFFALAAGIVTCACAALGQESLYEQFRGHNTAMKAVQPTWMGPLIQPDSRFTQLLRLSFSNSYTPSGAQTVNYGNYHTVGVIANNRMQFNFMAPPYVQNNSAAVKDGFGDAMVEAKYRIASGNAAHGNFALTALACYSVPTGSYQNGAPSGVWYPTVAVGKMWGRFDLQTTLGGMMPTGRIWAQGRQIQWNTTGQMLVGTKLWLDLEDNANYNYGGPLDGTTENFLTPAAFYVVKRKAWKPAHAIFVPGVGMQIATSRFHPYNHNLIPELRVLF